MKRIILFLVGLLFISSVFAETWGHRYDVLQTEQNPTIYVGNSVVMSIEWGEGDWDPNGSQIGYGTTKDGNTWSWEAIDWFEDGGGSNKRCKVTLTFDEPGDYYYAYKFTKGGTSSYQYGSADWSANADWDEALIVSYIRVNEKEDYSGVVLAPTVAELSVDSIVLTAVEGYEYAVTTAGGDSLDLSFQDTPVFKGLLTNSNYDFYQRVKETDTTKASVLSERLTVSTPVTTQVEEPLLSELKVFVDNTHMRLTITSDRVQPARVSVISLSGQLQASYDYAVNSGMNSIVLPQTLNQGLYLVAVHLGDERFVKKVIIQ